MRFWKCWFFHDWSKWNEIDSKHDEKGGNSWYIYRRCFRCGLTDTKRVVK